MSHGVNAFLQLLQLHADIKIREKSEADSDLYEIDATALSQPELDNSTENIGADRAAAAAMNDPNVQHIATRNIAMTMTLPAATISDWPDFEHRSVLWSYRRLCEQSSNHAGATAAVNQRNGTSEISLTTPHHRRMHDYILLLSRLRINRVFLVEDVDLSPPSADDVRVLHTLCGKYFIELIPTVIISSIHQRIPATFRDLQQHGRNNNNKYEYTTTTTNGEQNAGSAASERTHDAAVLFLCDLPSVAIECRAVGKASKAIRASLSEGPASAVGYRVEAGTSEGGRKVAVPAAFNAASTSAAACMEATQRVLRDVSALGFNSVIVAATPWAKSVADPAGFAAKSCGLNVQEMDLGALHPSSLLAKPILCPHSFLISLQMHLIKWKNAPPHSTVGSSTRSGTPASTIAASQHSSPAMEKVGREDGKREGCAVLGQKSSSVVVYPLDSGHQHEYIYPALAAKLYCCIFGGLAWNAQSLTHFSHTSTSASPPAVSSCLSTEKDRSVDTCWSLPQSISSTPAPIPAPPPPSQLSQVSEYLKASERAICYVLFGADWSRWRSGSHSSVERRNSSSKGSEVATTDTAGVGVGVRGNATEGAGAGQRGDETRNRIESADEDDLLKGSRRTSWMKRLSITSPSSHSSHSIAPAVPTAASVSRCSADPQTHGSSAGAIPMAAPPWGSAQTCGVENAFLAQLTSAVFSICTGDCTTDNRLSSRSPAGQRATRRAGALGAAGGDGNAGAGHGSSLSLQSPQTDASLSSVTTSTLSGDGGGGSSSRSSTIQGTGVRRGSGTTEHELYQMGAAEQSMLSLLAADDADESHQVVPTKRVAMMLMKAYRRLLSAAEWNQSFVSLSGGFLLSNTQSTVPQGSPSLPPQQQGQRQGFGNKGKKNAEKAVAFAMQTLQLEANELFSRAHILSALCRAVLLSAIQNSTAFSLSSSITYTTREGGSAGAGTVVAKTAVGSATAGRGNLHKRCAVYDNSEDYSNFPLESKIFPKTDEIRALLTRVVQSNILFRGYEFDQFDSIVDAFEPVIAMPGDVIIKQGDSGEHFFIIESGSVDLFIENALGAQIKIGKQLLRGDYFGEIALMYNTPRFATVVANGSIGSSDNYSDSVGFLNDEQEGGIDYTGVLADGDFLGKSTHSPRNLHPAVTNLWRIDRHTYRTIITQKNKIQSDERIKLVKDVTLLGRRLGDVLLDEEIEKIVSSLDCEEFTPGTVIVRQYQAGDYFYIIQEGQVDVWQDIPPPPPPPGPSPSSLSAAAGAFSSISSSSTPPCTPIVSPKQGGALLSAPGTPNSLSVVTGTKVATLTNGDYFGELALIDEDVRKASCVAVGRVVCLSLCREDFTAMLGRWQDRAEADRQLAKIVEESKEAAAEVGVGTTADGAGAAGGVNVAISGIVPSNTRATLVVLPDGKPLTPNSGRGGKRMSQFVPTIPTISARASAAASPIISPPPSPPPPSADYSPVNTDTNSSIGNASVRSTAVLRAQQQQIAPAPSIPDHGIPRSTEGREGGGGQGASVGGARSRNESLESYSGGSSYVLEPEEDTKKVAVTSLSELTLQRTLGEGAFGRVILATHKSSGREFALKCQAKATIIAAKMTNAVTRELEVLTHLPHHPCIVSLFGAFQDTRNVYMLLELLPGGEFFHYLQSAGKVPEKNARFFAASVVAAFDALHAMRIAYRDLKPENLVMDHKGFLKLVDLGLAKKIVNCTWTMCGTPEYIAPEVVLNKGHGCAVDLWALGVFTYEMVDGWSPFYEENPMKTFEKICSSRVSYPASFSSDLVDLLSRLLQRKPAKRLGNLQGGVGDIIKHHWFGSFDWQGLLRGSIPAPFVPPSHSSGVESTNKEEEAKITVEDLMQAQETDWTAIF